MSKSKSSATALEPKNERMVLAGALSAIASKGDAFVKAIDDFKVLRQETLVHLETELQTFKRQREDAEQEFEHSKRAKRINVEQELSEFGYTAALKILTERKEVPIAESEWKMMSEKLKDADANVKKAVDEEHASSAKTLGYEKRTLQLQHEKEIATLTSQVDSLSKQLASARDEISKAEERLASERGLCKSIAESCKSPQIVQNLGK